MKKALTKPENNLDLKPYRIFGLTTIQIMIVVALLGIFLTLILKHYFPALAQ